MLRPCLRVGQGPVSDRSHHMLAGTAGMGGDFSYGHSRRSWHRQMTFLPFGQRRIAEDIRLECLWGTLFAPDLRAGLAGWRRSEEHTSELPSLMRISSAVYCLKKKKY